MAKRDGTREQNGNKNKGYIGWKNIQHNSHQKATEKDDKDNLVCVERVRTPMREKVAEKIEVE